MFATILLPNFYLQAALRHEPNLRSKAIAVLDGDATKALLLEVNETAEKAGVCAGMAPSQALARCLHLIVKARARSQEQCVTEVLLEHAFTLSPLVEATAPGVCTVQFTTYQNLQEKAERVIEQLCDVQITAQAGIGPTPDASLLAAHFGRPVLRIGDARTFLASLPIEALAQT